jgi:hypothetical protein
MGDRLHKAQSSRSWCPFLRLKGPREEVGRQSSPVGGAAQCELVSQMAFVLFGWEL